jgi:maleylacetoacetate isomerase/maleylpyruvate isomerase
MKLYSYWRSQASYRVRIALHLKGLKAEIVSLDLIKGDQLTPEYRAVNPEMVVPALIADGGPPLIQSLAIVEYLDERYPEPPLLPRDLKDRAHVRALAQTVAMDAHPFVVPRVRKYLERELKLDEPARLKWLRHWLDSGTRTLEELLARDTRTGRFCYGDAPTVADLCLAAHVNSAKMLYGFDAAPYPTVRRIFDRCMELEAFSATHPLRQPDAPQPAAGTSGIPATHSH